MLRVALFQPDIPQNTGTIIRTSAALGFYVDIIEPCGFVFSDKFLKRSAMDYEKLANYSRFSSFSAYEEFLQQNNKDVVLVTTKASLSYKDYNFNPKNTVLLFGSESSGLPQSIHEKYGNKVKVPMQGDARSLNLAITVGMLSAHILV